MNIEEKNRMIIRNRFNEERSSNHHGSSQHRINEELMNSVREHRRIHGIISGISILRQLAQTRKWTRTVVAS